jgi:hypothetical protein
MKYALLIFAVAASLHAADAPRVSAESIAAAEKIFGLEFSAKERCTRNPSRTNSRLPFFSIRGHEVFKSQKRKGPIDGSQPRTSNDQPPTMIWLS